MSVVIRPASLWTHYMFAATSRVQGAAIQLSLQPDLCAELLELGLFAESQEGPW